MGLPIKGAVTLIRNTSFRQTLATEITDFYITLAKLVNLSQEWKSASLYDTKMTIDITCKQ
jgi:hypothetical protein